MQRTLLTLLIVAGIATTYLLMLRGWRRSEARAAHIARPHDLLDAPVVSGPWCGRFLGTTLAGQWLQRVNAHTLGVRSDASIAVTTRGINVTRPGSSSFGIPTGDVIAARADSGIAGRAYGTGGIVVVTFTLGGELLEFGMRFPSTADHIAALAALSTTEVSS